MLFCLLFIGLASAFADEGLNSTHVRAPCKEAKCGVTSDGSLYYYNLCNKNCKGASKSCQNKECKLCALYKQGCDESFKCCERRGSSQYGCYHQIIQGNICQQCVKTNQECGIFGQPEKQKACCESETNPKVGCTPVNLLRSSNTEVVITTLVCGEGECLALPDSCARLKATKYKKRRFCSCGPDNLPTTTAYRCTEKSPFKCIQCSLSGGPCTGKDGCCPGLACYKDSCE